MSFVDIDHYIKVCLSAGLTPHQTADALKRLNINPNSVSFVEKKIRKLKNKHNAKTSFQLGFLLGKMENEKQ